MPKELQVGDTVTYSAKFMRSCGMHFQVGTAVITSFDGEHRPRLAFLLPDPVTPGVEPIADKVLECNLVRFSERHMEAP